MIIRLLTRGQYRLSDEAYRTLNEIDNRVAEAVDANDEDAFQERLREMVEFVEREGSPVGDEELLPSECILPPPDTTLDEARHDFAGEGVIPG